MTDPQPGDFAVVRMAGATGRLIRAGQWLNGDGFADYEHAFIYAGDDTVIEAEPGGAKYTPLDEYNGVPMLWSTGRIPLADGQRTAILAAAEQYIGTPYSFADYAAIAAHRLHLSTGWLRRRIANTGHMICSQLVDQAYADAGVTLFDDGRWPGYVTPGDLYHRILKGAQQ